MVYQFGLQEDSMGHLLCETVPGWDGKKQCVDISAKGQGMNVNNREGQRGWNPLCGSEYHVLKYAINMIIR